MVQENLAVHTAYIRKQGVKTFFGLLFLGLVCISSSRFDPGSIKGKDLMVVGRSRITSKGVELITSGSYFSFAFSGRDFQLKIFLPDGVERSYIQYEIDGVYQRRIKIKKGGGTITLHADTLGRHIVSIYKATEAQSGGVFVEEILANNIKPLPISRSPLIEYIGDSITCGAASDTSETPCGTGSYIDFHNAYLAYGPRVARALNANFILSGASGKGIYRNWNDDGPGVPEFYRITSMIAADTMKWNYNSYHPDIISIALGTNDLSDGDHKSNRLPFDNEKFIQTYVRFVELLKEHHPAAKIAILNSPMLNGQKKQSLENAMVEIKAIVDRKFKKAVPVKLIYFTAMKPNGCNGHPSTEDHREMAFEVTAKFKELLEEKR